MPVLYKGNKPIIFIDNSRAEVVGTCHTLGYVKVIEQLKRPSTFSDIPMKVGSGFHAGLEEYIKTGDAHKGHTALVDYLAKHVQPTLDILKNILKSTIQTAEHEVTQTQKRYPGQYDILRMGRLFKLWTAKHSIESFGLQPDKMQSEVRFCVPVDVEQEDQPDVWLCGQFDIHGVNYKNLLVGKDLKTMGWLKPSIRNEYLTSTQLMGYTFAMHQLLKSQSFHADGVAGFDVYAIEIPDARSKQECKTHKVEGTICDLQHARMETISDIKFTYDTLHQWRNNLIGIALYYRYLHSLHEERKQGNLSDALLKERIFTTGMFHKAGFTRTCAECSLNSFCYKDGRDFDHLRTVSITEGWFPYEEEELQAIVDHNY